MKPEQLSELPIVFQIIAGAGLFFGTFILAIGGWLWKTIKPKLPDALKPAETGTTDVIIQAAAIADTQAIKSLAGSIEKLVEFMRDQGEDSEHQLDRNRRVLCEIRDINAEIRDGIDGLSKHMKGRTIV